ncbi:GTP cyclohydrolase II [Caminibacter mediatlanticus TB-2]|uniref:GTP cyclohydrolase-2 n=1 Tax=Caminibacter mediatlanticus TB-2 TaxID=391592 RepID=A0ABX5V7P6_9BACT|nr:GTP cyclohydrolase II [Caminibacter mediatlanticus]QCT94253.1 GTP cyclohydrolase II [Caminibacter mediatlanticus TB-2]
MEKSKIANLPTKFGNFKIQSFKENDKEHLVIFTENLPEIPIVRIHSECLTGDALGSLKCDCGEQLQKAMEIINENGGMIIYLRQEGRGIGLFNKVNAYALQDKGFDTVEANHQLGFEADLRDFSIVEEILKEFNIKKIKLLTNNPKKEFSLKNIEVVKRIPIKPTPNPYNEKYLKTKKEKLGHKL